MTKKKLNKITKTGTNQTMNNAQEETERLQYNRQDWRMTCAENALPRNKDVIAVIRRIIKHRHNRYGKDLDASVKYVFILH